MNYIAHIHLAASTNTSLIGNFLGDFVKGNEPSQLSEDVQQGIALHRKIDSFTDSHCDVKALKKIFPKDLRRVSGICIDIWFDYLLLKFNQEFPPQLEETLFEVFYQELKDFEMESMPYKKVRSSLLNGRWLQHYKLQQTCLNAFKSVEVRLNNKIIFAESAYQFMADNQLEIENRFQAFYPQLIDYCHSLIKPDCL